MKPIDSKQTADVLVKFLTETLKNAGFAKAVLGVSGGVDSAVSCALAVRALGVAGVYPILMPYGALSTEATLTAMSFVQGLGIPIGNISRIDIKSAVDALAVQLSLAGDNARRGNLMARMRMSVLFDQAKRRQALVVGTENKSEHLLGYFTRFGDEASDIEPLRHLYKTQVYELAKFLGVPETIISAKPTAGLWPEQTDEGDFGFTYREADEIMTGLFDEKMPESKLVERGLSQALIDKVKARVEDNAFKHHLPHIP